MRVSSNRGLRQLVIIAACVGMLTACTAELTPEAQQVREEIETVSSNGREYAQGSLAGGVAVMVDDRAAYWIRDDVVHAVNNTAKEWSPSLAFPVNPNTTEDTVRAAIN